MRNHLVGSGGAVILLFTGLTNAEKSSSAPPFLPVLPPETPQAPQDSTPLTPAVTLLVSPNLVMRSAGGQGLL